MATTTLSPPSRETCMDILLWRKKILSLSVLGLATATWLLIHVYDYTFLTVGSWFAMSILVISYVWANILALIGREVASMMAIELSEQSMLDAVVATRVLLDEAVHWLFLITVERELLAFAQVLAALWLLSLLGTYFDFVTLVYICVLLALTLTPIYVNYEVRIEECRERVKIERRKWYGILDDKILGRMRKKAVIKEKKVD
ncbi:reticulon-like protein B13 [Tasmannia lanceolata]|uniref:reticulon-like protein B13 n=1 Tax=Tasmannia lanceolata TaxID=3420 RepID=UPI0040647FCE